MRVLTRVIVSIVAMLVMILVILVIVIVIVVILSRIRQALACFDQEQFLVLEARDDGIDPGFHPKPVVDQGIRALEQHDILGRRFPIVGIHTGGHQVIHRYLITGKLLREVIERVEAGVDMDLVRILDRLSGRGLTRGHGDNQQEA